MNSTIEAIAYGVPLVAIPVKADHPRVARRAVDELRLELSELSATRVANAIETVIGKKAKDCSHQRRVLEASAVSRQHNGSLNAACEIVDCISSRTQTNSRKQLEKRIDKSWRPHLDYECEVKHSKLAFFTGDRGEIAFTLEHMCFIA